MTEIDEKEHHAAVSETAGSILKAAREAAGMTLEQAAEKLHLLKVTIVALEENDTSRLPSRVFTLGYMKNYARIVDVPESRIMELVRDEAGEVEEVRNLKQPNAPQIRSRKRHQENGGRLFFKAITWLIMIAIIALLVLWWRGAVQLPDLSGLPFLPATEEQQNNVTSVDDDSEMLTLSIGSGAVPQQKTEISPDVSVTDEQTLKAGGEGNNIELSLGDSDASATTGVEQSGQNSTDEAEKKSTKDTTPEKVVENVAAEAEAENDAVVTAESDAVEDQLASSGEKITLDFADKCWVNVNDAQGNIVLYGEMSAGTSKTLDGESPFTFVLGNAVKVKVSVDGRPYDIAPHIRGGVARFSLGTSDQ